MKLRFSTRYFTELPDSAKLTLGKVNIKENERASGKQRDEMTQEQLANLLLLKRNLHGIDFDAAFKVTGRVIPVVLAR